MTECKGLTQNYAHAETSLLTKCQIHNARPPYLPTAPFRTSDSYPTQAKLFTSSYTVSHKYVKFHWNVTSCENKSDTFDNTVIIGKILP